MARRYIPPDRRPLPFEDWPDGDRHTWDQALQPGNLLTDPGPASHWRPATRQGYWFAYGRWLAFLERHGWLLSEETISERPTPERIVAYIGFLQAQNLASLTVWSYLNHLCNALYRLTPETDWAWLRDLVNRLHLGASRKDPVTPKMIPIGAIFRRGIEGMREADRLPPQPLFGESVKFRDFLMLSLLAAAPIRLANFGALRLGEHLIRQSEGYLLVVPREQVKNRRTLEIPLHDELTPWIDRYLAHHRPQLLQGNDASELWVTRYGRVMLLNAVGMRIPKVTQRYLGVRLSAHLFRHCAATSVATEDPRHVRIIPAILFHSTGITGERYYNRATMLEAGRRHAALLAELKQELLDEAA